MPAPLYEEPYSANELGPKNHAAVPAQSDTVDLAQPALGIYAGGAGILKVTTVGDDTVTFAAVPAGTTINLRIKRVWQTTTTATSLVVFW